MELILIQSQEHNELPLAELKAVMECENINANINVISEGLVVLDSISENHLDSYYKILVRRLGYTHEVHELITQFNYDNLDDEILSINWSNYIDENFAVRVKRFKSDIDSAKLEGHIGFLILSTFNDENKVSVKLRNPKSYIKVIVCENNVFVAIRRYELNKKHFEDNKPHKRPFFYPGSMSPKLARCMVNLSRVKENELLLDPFCGTGGILIEGGLIGCKVLGSDINWKMKNGSAINLEHCGITNYRTFNVDIRELEMYEKVSAVVTDPPYGISSSTSGMDGEAIFIEFFNSIYDNMRDDAYLCMASPHYLDLDNIFDEVGFELLESYSIKMHRSLTRIISVLRKK